jgi:protein involved in polysaccharide export with SLBB domain
MNMIGHPRNSWLRRDIALCILTLIVIAPTFLAVGCSDHRMSLKQFLQTQEEAMPVCAATTQPTTQPAAEPVASQPSREVMGPYHVGPGDVLGITLSGADLPAMVAPIQARIDRDGNIDLPIVGKVFVAGMELQDVEKAIQSAYVPSVYRQLSVHLELIRPDTVTVLVTGAVTTPGLVQLPRTQRNLLYAIAGAGGASNIASGEVTLRSLRNPSQEATFNLLQPAQLQEALAMEPLQNGDIVTVQAAPPNAIFIGGLVMAPHVQVNPPGTQMNVLQALASAGGLRTDVTPTELTLIRHMPDGKDLHVKLDVERIQKGKDPNFNLAPGDILWAPDTLLTRAENWVNQNIFIRGGFTAVATYNVTGLDFMNNNAKQSALGINNVSLENTFDPFGFLIRQQQLSGIQNQLPAPQ